MFGRNRRILRSIVSGWVSLLSGVCVCIAGSIIGVYRYLGAIYSWPGAKVPHGHARHWLSPLPISAVMILTSQLSWASAPLLRAKLMSDVESARKNLLHMIRRVSKSSKVIRDHMRSLTSDDLEWPNVLRSISGVLEFPRSWNSIGNSIRGRTAGGRVRRTPSPTSSTL